MASTLPLRHGKAFIRAERSCRCYRLEPAGSNLRLKPSRQSIRSCSVAYGQDKKADPDPLGLLSNLKAEMCDRDDSSSHDNKPIIPEMLDELMAVAVTEIVRNIGDAPLLLSLYSKKGCRWIRVKKEKGKAVPECWSLVKRRWKDASCKPEGVMLVKQLDDGDEYDDEGFREDNGNRRNWGIAVQGRGLECTACYILKTNRVASTMGFCTYFYLVRVQCFGDPLDVQLKHAWLLG